MIRMRAGRDADSASTRNWREIVENPSPPPVRMREVCESLDFYDEETDVMEVGHRSRHVMLDPS